MHLKATWRNLGLPLCVALAAALPMTLCAQTNPPTPQSRPGFPGFHGAWGPGAPNRSVTPSSIPAPAPAAVAKPSAAVPVSQLPPTPVTVTPTPPAPPPPPATPAGRPAHRATVTYEDGLLTVKAHNSSLNQILRAIMRETGLQITGGVTEERVYGVYGPARVSTLLISLLDGSNVNLVYVPATADQPAQLTLTPRDGASPALPPSVTASDDLLPDGPEDDPTPQLNTGPDPGPSVPGQPTATQPNPGQPEPETQHDLSTPASGAAAALADPSATPRWKRYPVPPPTVNDVYQQLLQLHAAQQKMGSQPQQAAPAAPAAPAPAPAATPTTPAATN